jgi:protein-S-isoprenylcysteine O-methyltransferase Ste14
MQQSGRLFSGILVAVQVSTAVIIVLTGPLFAQKCWLFATELLSIALGVWSILTMRIGNFNITPDVTSGGKLVVRGPYRLIRHPMYLALLLATLTLVVDSFSTLRLILWLTLLIDLIVKLSYEERLLVAAWDEYHGYMKKTKRLIPFLF